MTWLLEYMGLVIEDHDLYQRNCRRRSHNYGKLPQILDRLFGTTFACVEGYKWKIDFGPQPKSLCGVWTFNLFIPIIFCYCTLKKRR
jgi:hypothetical protein